MVYNVVVVMFCISDEISPLVQIDSIAIHVPTPPAAADISISRHRRIGGQFVAK
jgi:hypothetical protein